MRLQYPSHFGPEKSRDMRITSSIERVLDEGCQARAFRIICAKFRFSKRKKKETKFRKIFNAVILPLTNIWRRGEKIWGNGWYILKM